MPSFQAWKLTHMTINLSNIKVHYPGVKALDGISIEIRPAEVHGIIGENGAGKSTLMNVLSGSVRPTSGAISVANDPVTFHKAADAVAAGISLVSQEGTLVPNLSAAANICLGFEPCRYGCLVQSAEISQTAKQLLKRWFPATEINLDVP